jgi:hypothetical protein
MLIVRRPKSHLIHSLLLLLAIPILFLNLWVMEKVQFMKLVNKNKIIGVGVLSIVIIITVYFLMKAKKRALLLLIGLSAFVISSNLYFLLTTKNYALAFYGLFLIIISSMYLLSTYRILMLSYYNSGKRWFEGKPKFIPQVVAEAEVNEHEISGWLSSIDSEGCYAFFKEKDLSRNPERLKLLFKDKILVCSVVPVSKMIDCADETTGLGCRFLVANADQSKDVSDFIECIRSAGYVQ